MTEQGLIVDLFAGGGGASTAIYMATGRHPDVAVNHNPAAIAMHRANHPGTRHMHSSVLEVDPIHATGGRPVYLMWASPDCTHFSKARGGKPVEKRIRSLADVVVHWVKALGPVNKPQVIVLENVEEFQDWGPVLENGRPCPERKGLDFRRWVRELQDEGYVVEWREVVAADYGAPTTRKRLFLVARCDGQPIRWPAPTHASRARIAKGDPAAAGLQPWRAAAEIINWNLDIPSVFDRPRPLKPKTMARIAKGIERYVIRTRTPFIVPVTHTRGSNTARDAGEPAPTLTTSKGGEFAIAAPSLMPVTHDDPSNRSRSLLDPAMTPTAAHRGELAVSAAYLSRQFGTTVTGRGLDAPHPVVMAEGGGGKSQVVAAHLGSVGYGEGWARPGLRAWSADDPVGVVTGSGDKTLVAASIDKYHATGVAQAADRALDAITAKARFGLNAAFLEQANTGAVGHAATDPLSTIIGGGGMDVGWGTTQRLIQASMIPANDYQGASRRAQVIAFLWRHFGEPTEAEWADPLATDAGRLKFGLVIVDGAIWQIVDIGMRMLKPRELFNAQGFPPDYAIELTLDRKPLTITAQTALAGNSVSPPPAAAILRANLPDEWLWKEAA